jgi:transposase
MPPLLQFGQELNQNARRGPNLTSAQRLIIIAKAGAGATVRELVEEFGRSANCIRTTIRLAKTRDTTQEAPRSGRPSILSRHQKKIIYRKARAAPKIEYSQLAEVGVFANPDGSFTKPPSRSTLYRALKRRGLTNFRCKKRPKLTRGHALRRLKFCRQYRNFPWARRTLKFSDECSVEKGSGHNQEWCFRFPWEKWKPEMISALPTSRKPAQMVWGAIWLDERGRPRRSKLVIMERDPDAPRCGYSSQSYIETLQEGLLPHYRRSQVFMQDNARIHTSRATRAWLALKRVRTIDWPAYSPDLNPIEHLWWHLKKRMNKFYPQYNNYMRGQEEWDGFCSALQECWRAIPSRLIRALILSMPRRMQACRRARGWQTKY